SGVRHPTAPDVVESRKGAGVAYDPVSPPATSVGSRTGAPALAEMPLDHATSPAPATSNATCGFAESARGVSPRAAPRSGHEPLDSSGSCHPPKTAAFR